MNRYMLYSLAFVLVLAMSFSSGCATRPKPPRGTSPIVVSMEVTGYCKCGKCCNWKRTWYGRPVVASGPSKGKRKKVGQTACGTKGKIGTIAADTTKYPFGTVMYIPGYGYGKVEDRGKAIQGEKLDLFFKSHHDAIKWGRQHTKVKIWVENK